MGKIQTGIATKRDNFRKSVSVPDNELIAMPKRVIDYFSKGRFRDAVEYAARFEPLTDRPFELPVAVGDCHLELRAPGEALRRYCQALEFKSSAPVAKRLVVALEQIAATEKFPVDVPHVAESMLTGLRELENFNPAAALTAFETVLGLWPKLAAAEEWHERASVRLRLKGKFCERPFEHLHINRGGVATLCCSGWLKVSPGNIVENTREELWNSRAAVSVRESILDGNFRFCSSYRCPHVISGDLKPISKLSDPRRREMVSKRLTHMNSFPRRIALNYDKSCNLSCPSCRSTLIQLRNAELETAQRIQRTLNESWLDKIDSLKMNNSGDSFGSPLSRQLLSTLDQTRYPDLKLELITNGIALTQSAWRKFEKLRPMIKTLEISVDAACAGTYAVVRRGGDFATLLNNFDLIRKIRDAGDIPRWHLSFVVQTLNFREMKSFVLLAIEYGVDKAIFKKVTPRNGQQANTQSFIDQFEIHNPRNSDCDEFLQQLQDPVFDHPVIHWSNLEGLRERSVSKVTRPQFYKN